MPGCELNDIVWVKTKVLGGYGSSSKDFEFSLAKITSDNQNSGYTVEYLVCIQESL